MATIEKDIEKYLRVSVQRAGGLCLKWVCPGWAGVPDRIVLMPGGRLYFVELKRPEGGVPSKQQLWWKRKLMTLGFDFFFIFTKSAVNDFVEYIQPKQGYTGKAFRWLPDEF